MKPTLFKVTKQLLIILFVLNFSALDLSAAGKTDLLLKAGRITPEANLEAIIANPDVKPDEVFGGSYFRLIQFNDIPDAATQVALKVAGIELVSYIPNHAYMAVIQRYASLEPLRAAGARSVIRMQTDWKISSQLKGTSFPDWANADDKNVDVVIRYYKNLDVNPVTAALLSKGGQLIRRYDYGSWMEIRIPKTSIYEYASLPFVAGIEPIAPPSEPDDEKGRSLHRSNVINSYSPMGRHYDGTGVVAALADDGPVGPHIDYQGRIDQSNTTANNGTHGDMTTGILMGAGNLNPTIAGMGTGTFIYIYDINGYNHVLNSPTTNTTLGVMVTSTSYSQGCNDYTTDTQTGDQILHDNPTLLHVYSAGNNGGADCGYGAGAGWANVTGGYKQGKNVIACGNLNYLDALEASSSRGPSSDGRVKPDICANGAGQLSTDGPNDYQVGGGTSAACPGIAGIVTQLHHAYRELNGGANAEGALIKACLLNTADDLGNAGPDFKFGWGRVNAFRAVTTLEDVRYVTDEISQGATINHTITVPANTQQLRVMVLWTDVEGDPLAAKSLVNDINMVVTDPSSTSWNPWILDPSPNATSLNLPAVRGVDDLNNMEQVTLDGPVAGTYTISLTGFAIPQGPQKYYVVYEFVGSDINVTYPIGYEGFVPGETETLRWDAFGATTSFNLEYSTDNGGSWNSINPSVGAAVRQYNWTVPNTVTGEALVRITRGTTIGQSPENFAIIGLPTNIDVDWACPDSMRLTWNAVPGAVGYEVSRLGVNYMDSIAFSTTTSAILTGLNPFQDQWFSVKAYTPGNDKGRRANAIYKAPGVFSCPIQIDASLNQVNSPSGSLLNCHDLSNVEINIEVENSGIAPISNIPVFYSVNGGPVVSEVVTATLNSFATATYPFAATYDFTAPGIYDLQVWTDYTADGNSYNDTVLTTITVVAGTVETLPYSENFETFNLCATTTNCEVGQCALTNGWINGANLAEDDIDWRTSQGATPSVDTGPDQDHNPGNATGNYLYLEASACFNKEAIMTMPCIDLTASTSPEMRFWYHMYGAAMGTLHVDVFHNDVWQNDVTPPITGNQGTIWLEKIVNLTPYAGSIINIRFRGNTGNDFTSDMAIDDINIYEASAPPVANFVASATNICPNETITISDLSQNSPSAWAWTITPASGYTFVNGTSATSQNPQVQFTVDGNYDVSLVATNGFGSNTYTINSYIVVGAGAALPLIETFQGATFPPANWEIENPDLGTTWQSANVVSGPFGTATTASFMNNFIYNAAGQEDGLLTQRMDLSASISPMLTFDISHARYSAAFEDALRIDISTDCGVTFIPTGYLKQGVALATAPDQTNTFSPVSAAEWRNDTLDLAGYVGSEVIVKFINITGYGNSLFIDNINYVENPLGLNDLNENAISIAANPNPSSGLFYVNIMTINSGEVARVTIMDTKGAQLKTNNYKLNQGNTRFQTDLSEFGRGIYLLEVQTGNYSKTLKLVVL